MRQYPSASDFPILFKSSSAFCMCSLIKPTIKSLSQQKVLSQKTELNCTTAENSVAMK